MVDCDLPVPCTQTVDVTGTALTITNTRGQFGGDAIAGFAVHGVGVFGGAVPPEQGGDSFTTGVQGSATGGIGVLGTSGKSFGVIGSGGAGGVQGSTGSGVAVHGQTGAGTAGVFEVTDESTNPNPALLATTMSLGPATAGRFRIVNPNNRGAALDARTSGGGRAAFFRNEANLPGGDTAVSLCNPGLGVLIETNGTGLHSRSGTDFPAGVFDGDVRVFGTLTATSKFFVMDHPLDPANSYLVHASVESSEQANLYTGNVVLDDAGEAVVELPEWVEALNEDFRYQLTCIGGAAAVYVAREMSQGSFTIGGGAPGMKVSWQLVGRRKDLWAQAHPLVVEEEKPAGDKGLYRHPELFGQGAEKSVLRPSAPEPTSRGEIPSGR
ncbi:hypothetical protein GCM10027451_40370 [Geodermatophilus aquaeductus]|uniref:Uncharacterized protein n=1 Tax=Geodermatophilus aquaeductus TaxID=1564161 RepID=A0A521FMA2_9ACTN|nr:hypothetical protein [Geodermatophilus aquaeductus]SMO97353.1 hypothetical protein SAMN06273567_11164 [Geodermatophilus aquaeductus]